MFTCRKLWDNLCLFIESLHKLNPLVVSSLRSFKKTLTVNVCTPCGNTSICSTNVISIQQYVHSTWTHLWMEPTLYMQMSLNIRSNHLDSFVNGTNLIYMQMSLNIRSNHEHLRTLYRRTLLPVAASPANINFLNHLQGSVSGPLESRRQIV